MHDGWIKNIYRGGVKILNKGKYGRYISDIRTRGENLPDFTLLTSIFCESLRETENQTLQ